MRLLILTPECEGHGGGIMTFYQALSPALSHLGVEVRIIAGNALHSSEKRNPRFINGVCIEDLERKNVEKQWERFQAFAATPGLRRHLAAAWALWEQSDFGENADIVEACDWGLLFLPPAIEATRPLVVQCHGSIGQVSAHDPVAGEEVQASFIRLLERNVMPLATSVQVSSRADAAFWQSETGREVLIVRPAWKAAGASTEQNPAKRGLVVGRVQRWKGPQTVCAALAKLGSRAPSIDWIGRDTVWGSPGNSSAAFLARTYPDVWGRRVFHHPGLPPSDIRQRQRSALFNLAPSTWDVFNFTVIEAMTSGRPTIVSTGAGAGELVEDGVNGFAFPAGDAEALAEAIERVMRTSPARLEEISRAAQETVRTSLDPEKIAAQRIAAYRKAIDDFKRNPPSPIGGWLGDICRPSEKVVRDGMGFLDHHPLRRILAYCAGRIGRRLWPQ